MTRRCQLQAWQRQDLVSTSWVMHLDKYSQKFQTVGREATSHTLIAQVMEEITAAMTTE